MKIRILTIAILVSVLSAVAWAGYRAGVSSVTVEWQEDRLRAASQIQAIVGEFRERERRLNDEVQSAEDRLAEAAADTRRALDAALDGIDTGRLRERFRSCPSGVPETTAPTEGDDGAGERGLSAADQRFLIRIGAEADQVASRLEACQAYVSSLQ